MAEWDTIKYWEHTVWKVEKSVEYRKKELKQKIVNWNATKAETDELTLLKD